MSLLTDLSGVCPLEQGKKYGFWEACIRQPTQLVGAVAALSLCSDVALSSQGWPLLSCASGIVLAECTEELKAKRLLTHVNIALLSSWK